MHDTQTIDLSAEPATVAEQHHLLDRLAQLADVHDRVGFADDHVLTMLIDRYREREQLRTA